MPSPSPPTKPPYLRALEYLRDLVETGQLADGDYWPSVRQLTTGWPPLPKMSRVTAQKIHARLRAEGLAETERGIGTVVKSPVDTREPG